MINTSNSTLVTTNCRQRGGIRNASYPYTRSQECAWHPDEAARNLSSLIESVVNSFSHVEHRHLYNHISLLSRGVDTSHIPTVRRVYGSNKIHGDEHDSDDGVIISGDYSRGMTETNIRVLSSLNKRMRSTMRNLQRKYCPWILPVAHALKSQLTEPLILMLLASAMLSLLLGNAADAISIGVALSIVSLVAAVQEYRSERALERLSELMPHTCTVMRDGQVQSNVRGEDLVMGDLVLLGTGDRVPADVRVVDGVELSVDESSLTGENTPVLKTSEALSYFGDAGLGMVGSFGSSGASITHAGELYLSSTPALTDQRNICFMGTLVCTGRGRALVIATGQRTEFGKVAKELSEVEERKSPLQVKIDELGRMLAYLSTMAIVAIALLGWFMGRPFLETVTVAVSLAVAAIPEGLPICVTVTLALGVLRMAKRNAIVKKLPAVESLGCATVVASDKTGTLTKNEMTVRGLWCLAFREDMFELTGVGYDVVSGDRAGYAASSTSRGDIPLLSSSTALTSSIGRVLKHSHPPITPPSSAPPSPPSESPSDGVGGWASNNSRTASRGVEYARLHSNGRDFTITAGATTTVIDKVARENSALQAVFGVASLCNNSVVSPEGSGLSGQPTELALLVGAIKAGVADPRPLYHRLQEIPFSSDRKRMDVLARPVGGPGAHCCTAYSLAARRAVVSPRKNQGNASYSPSNNVVPASVTLAVEGASATPSSKDGSLYFVKGMPEAILGECTSYTSSDGSSSLLSHEDKIMARSQARRMAATGLRVLALAYGPSLEDLTFAGLIGMEDPPRTGVLEAVKQLKDGGVKVLMVTGDSKETALAIARRCGIVEDNHSRSGRHASWHYHQGISSGALLDDIEAVSDGICLSGEELDSIPSAHLSESILGINVFYRVAPRHKLSLVRALQSQGEIVAMTGDGVNDATALKAADIGVAMGKCGTDVAKEAADIVLADDDFATITSAVAEGKGIFFNIRNFLAFQLSTSFAVLTMESFATAAGLPNPLNAMQILWINIIMDGPPAQSLGVEPVEDHVLKAKPRRSGDPIITSALLTRAVTSAVLIVFLTLKVFANELEDGKVGRRDTTLTFMTFVNCDLFNAYACRSSERCFYEMDLFGNPTFLWAIGGSVVGQLLVVYFPPLQEVFQTEALGIFDMAYVLALSSTVLMLDTIRKKFFEGWCSDTKALIPIKMKKYARKKRGSEKSSSKFTTDDADILEYVKNSNRKARRFVGRQKPSDDRVRSRSSGRAPTIH